SGRLQEFASVSQVEAGLQFLIDKYPPLVARLARAPGTKEARYAHLLSGEEGIEQQEAVSAAPARSDRIAALEAEVAALRAEVEGLATQFAEFRKQFE